MNYFKITVFGTTVMAAAIAEILGKDVLIIEKSESAATDYSACINARQAKISKSADKSTNVFIQELSNRNLISENGLVHVFPLSGLCSSYFLKSNVLLSTDITDIKEADEEYELTLFNIDGFSKIRTSKIIDTTTLGINTVHPEHYKKYLNAVIVGKNPPESSYLIKGRFEDEYIFSMEADKEKSYTDAVSELCSLWEKKACAEFSEFKLASIAPCFAYIFDKPYKKQINKNYIHKPSASFENLSRAFEEGIYEAELYL